jgi:ketosteroid isomerase-like protein
MNATDALFALENDRLKATIAIDVARLGEIYDDDLVYVHSSGKADDKAAVIDMLVKNRHIVGLERGTLVTHVWDGVAVMSGPIHYRFRRPDGSEIAMDAFATQTFRAVPGGWTLVSFQATTLKAP